MSEIVSIATTFGFSDIDSGMDFRIIPKAHTPNIRLIIMSDKFIFILFDDMQFYRLSVPVCYLSSYFNLDLFRILVDYKVDYVVNTRFEEKLALIQE